jgi:hypothetical protein
MTAVLANRVAANRLVATPVQAQAAIGSPIPTSPGLGKAASGCRCRQARAGPTCPPQRVRRNGCSPRLPGPDNHRTRPPIRPVLTYRYEGGVAGVQ